MHVDAFARNFGFRGIEAFKFQLAKRAAIHGISELGAEGIHIEPFRSPADFLIRRKSYPNCTVLDFGVTN
ncbi:hypothetical protein D3C77_547840 [compost metagenome]